MYQNRFERIYNIYHNRNTSIVILLKYNRKHLHLLTFNIVFKLPFLT